MWMVAVERQTMPLPQGADGLGWGSDCCLGSRGGKPIADPGFGLEVTRLAGVHLQLVPQSAHVHAQIFRIVSILGAPHAREKLAVRDDHIGPSYQRLQQ